MLPLNETTVRAAIAKATFGKRTQSALYVHSSGLRELPPELARLALLAVQALGPFDGNPDLLKFSFDGKSVSLLYYPEFDEDPHPKLLRSMRFEVTGAKAVVKSRRNYDWGRNPPILHRKELFVPAGYPQREIFAALSEAEERAGLLGSSKIGTIRQWRRLLMSRGARIDDHELILKSSGAGRS